MKKYLIVLAVMVFLSGCMLFPKEQPKTSNDTSEGASSVSKVTFKIVDPNAPEEKADSKNPKDISTVSLAQCLSAKKAVMYGASWCPHCQQQKQDFGDAFKYITYQECDQASGGDPEKCKQAGVEAYPTWLIPGVPKITGTKSLSELATLSGCSYSPSTTSISTNTPTTVTSDKSQPVTELKNTDPSVTNFSDQKVGVLISGKGFIPAEVSLVPASEVVLMNSNSTEVLLTNINTNCPEIPETFKIPANQSVIYKLNIPATCQLYSDGSAQQKLTITVK
jgi:hypothetical protein